MRELAIAGIWLFFSAALFYIESDIDANMLPFVARGKWVALALAVMNALRPVVKRLAMAAFGSGSNSNDDDQEFDEAPPKPRVRDEQVRDDFFSDEPPDDRIQPPTPPAPPAPPGAIKS